jgi:hypothetical protein
MYRKLVFSLCFFLFSVAIVSAEVNGPGVPSVPGVPGESDAKTLRGMSVLGNNEAPMSLFIVPWKSSELGVETSLTRTLNEHDVPVDREVFLRELDFYQVSAGSRTSAPAAVSQVLKTH